MPILAVVLYALALAVREAEPVQTDRARKDAHALEQLREAQARKGGANARVRDALDEREGKRLHTTTINHRTGEIVERYRDE